MAGYSKTPLTKKLGIKAGHTVALVSAPDDFADTLHPLPERVTLRDGLRSKELDVIIFFTDSMKALTARFPKLKDKLAETGGLWIAWPKKSSGRPTDLDGNHVRRIGLSHGLVDNKVCAIDETWSGHRFVVRTKDRKKKP